MLNVLLDPVTVAAALCEMTDEDLTVMDAATKRNPLAISRYLLDRFGLDQLAKIQQRHADTAAAIVTAAEAELLVAAAADEAGGQQ